MLHINVDTTGLDILKGASDIIEREARNAAKALQAMCHAKVGEFAGQRLHTRKQMYLEGVTLHEEDTVFIVRLDTKLSWIEEGMPEHSMLDGLLAGPRAKTNQHGEKYVIVPLTQAKSGQGLPAPTSAQTDLVKTLKDEFDKRHIPWKDLETKSDGSPKLGKLHSFNILNAPVKTKEGPFQGKGAIGDVRQGLTGTPFLQGVNVYQKESKGKVNKSVMTFRVAHERHRGQGLWTHPGLQGVNIFHEVEQWAENEFNNVIGPQLAETLGNMLSGLGSK